MQHPQERYNAIRARTQEVLERARQLYGVVIQPTISFNLTGRVAGWAGCKHCAGGRLYTLRFNQQMIAGKHFEDIMNETVPHEVAHLVCFARPDLGRNHDTGWRRVCLALGGNGKTRHEYDVVLAGGWDYITDRGIKVTIGARHHARVMAGQTLTFKRGKGSIGPNSPRVRSGQPFPGTPAPTPAPNTELYHRAANSLASRARDLLQAAQAQGLGQEWAVQEAVRTLGMGLDAARYYMRNNWERLAA